MAEPKETYANEGLIGFETEGFEHKHRIDRFNRRLGRVLDGV